jgi:hypothetical protein
VKNGLTKTGIYEKAYKEIAEFSKYLESIGLGVVSPNTEDKPFWFMFLDDAEGFRGRSGLRHARMGRTPTIRPPIFGAQGPERS